MRSMPYRRRWAVFGAIALVSTLAVIMPFTPAVAAESGGPDHPMIFPIEGDVTYTDTYGACRSECSRSHAGQDLMGRQLQRVIASADGRVTYFRDTATPSGSRGNMVIITDDAGWEYWYIHINNDSPGTDDGRQCRNLSGDTHMCDGTDWVFAPGVTDGARVYAGQHISYMGDSGNAEACNCPHIHFELHEPGGAAVNPYTSLRNAQRLVLDTADGSEPLGFATAFDDVDANGCMVYVDGDGYVWDETCEAGATRELALRDHWGQPSTGLRRVYGATDDQLLFCDWDGDGTDTPGVYRSATARWYLSNGLDGSADTPDEVFRYGRPGAGDLVLCGDWDGDGTDTVGVFRTSDNIWYLRNSNTAGNADATFRYGRPGLGDIPLVGDWNGDDADTPGVFRGDTNEWHLTNNYGGDAQYRFRYGNPSLGDHPVVGDFDGDGISTIAVARGNTWYVRDRLAGGNADRTIEWLPATVPSAIHAADWNGDGVDEPIVDLYRNVADPEPAA
jgi:hypothetical protein